MLPLPKNYRADLKYPGYIVMIAPTNCKDCDCAQRLVRCQKATAIEQQRPKLLTKDEARPDCGEYRQAA
jgi:hypothetical protein